MRTGEDRQKMTSGEIQARVSELLVYIDGCHEALTFGDEIHPIVNPRQLQELLEEAKRELAELTP